MGSATPSFSLREGIDVLDEALRLLDSPEKWTTGNWKCELYVIDPKTGSVRRDGLGIPIPKCDPKGRQLYAYCIEGAVNQAVINKFGPVRAKALGALAPSAPIKAEAGGYSSDQLDMGTACDLLSVNDITRELYATEWDHLTNADRPAQLLNDDEDGIGFGYEAVIRVLKTRRERLVAALRQKTGH